MSPKRTFTLLGALAVSAGLATAGCAKKEAPAPAANGKEAAPPVEPEEAEALDPDALKNPVQPR